MAYEPIVERLVRMNPDGTVIRYIKGFISSTDKKPMTGIADRSELFERDTGKWFLFNEKKKQWIVPDDYEGGGLTETDKTLSVSDMAADAKAVGDRLTIVENAQPAVIQEKVDEWLEDNITQETGYALDSTLSMANAAAPADKVGELKTAFDSLAGYEYSRLIATDFIINDDGSFTGSVGEQIQATTSSSYHRKVFTPVPGRQYRFTYTTRSGLSSSIAYIKTVDKNGYVLEDLDLFPKNTTGIELQTVHTFGVNVAQVWCRGRAGNDYPLNVDEYLSRVDVLEEDVEELQYRYSCPIPEEDGYSSTSFSDVYDAYDALCAAYPSFITKETDLGNDTAGNAIRHYHVNKRRVKVRTIDSATDLYTTYCPPKRILLTSGVHGDEKSGVWGLYYFLRDYLKSKQPWSVEILNNDIFDVVPVIDPWGYDNNSRNNYNDVNINRDYQSATPQAETTAVLSLISSFDGDLFAALDNHSTEGTAGYVSTRRTNSDVNAIMKLASDTIEQCATGWYVLASKAGISGYPYCYACLSANDGTLVDYLCDANITKKAMTVESMKKSGEKESMISKFNADLTGNLIKGLIETSTT